MKSAGFTLIEILIALFIFAILGVMVALGLHAIITAHQHLRSTDDQLQRLEVVQTLLHRDIRNIVDRSVLDGEGHRLPAVMSRGDGRIEFTRGGVLNPFSIARQSDMQRLAYSCQNGRLIRSIWPVLDRVNTTKPTQSVLLRGVEDCSFEFIGMLGQVSSIWPLPVQASEVIVNNQQQNQSNLPVAVRVGFSLRGAGRVMDLIPIASRGVANNQNQ